MDNIILYCHLFIDKSKGLIQTFKLVLPNFEHKAILDIKNIVEKEIELLKKKENTTTDYTIQYISKTVHSRSISDNIKLSAFFGNKDDIYCCVSKSI